jgi:hypothetical protein
MGEERKPKVEGQRGHHWRRVRQQQQAAGRAVKKTEAYKAPTSGLEDVVFNVGTAKDAALFEEHKKKLARYVAVNFKHGALMAQQAMEKMTDPEIK